MSPIRHPLALVTLVVFSASAHAAKKPVLAGHDFLSFAVPRIVKIVKANANRATELMLSGACFVGIERACLAISDREVAAGKVEVMVEADRDAPAGAFQTTAPAPRGEAPAREGYVSARQRLEKACTSKRAAGCRQWAELEQRAGKAQTARRLFTLACAYGDGLACRRIRPRDAREIASARASVGPLTSR